MVENKNVKDKIVTAAWELFREKGYDSTTVDDIIKASGTSKGSFYYYFSGKDAMLDTLSMVLDQAYEKLRAEMAPDMDSYDKLIYMNAKMHTIVEETVTVELMASLYSTQLTAKEGRSLLDQNRSYYRLVGDIVDEGQRRGQIINSLPIRDIVWYYAMCEHALIYEWCLSRGEYSLAQQSKTFMPMMLAKFREEPLPPRPRIRSGRIRAPLK
jgi:AcrR family transcriptional regulator